MLFLVIETQMDLLEFYIEVSSSLSGRPVNSKPEDNYIISTNIKLLCRKKKLSMASLNYMLHPELLS